MYNYQLAVSYTHLDVYKRQAEDITRGFVSIAKNTEVCHFSGFTESTE